MLHINKVRKYSSQGQESIRSVLEQDVTSTKPNVSQGGERKVETLWPVFQFDQHKSRYVCDLLCTNDTISREIYEQALENNIADKSPIARWEKQCYEDLCCLACIEAHCLCRDPKANVAEDNTGACILCGCRGCSGWWCLSEWSWYVRRKIVYEQSYNFFTDNGRPIHHDLRMLQWRDNYDILNSGTYEHYFLFKDWTAVIAINISKDMQRQI
jgi:bud site selection protein 31